MSGATSQLLSVESRVRKYLVQRNRECKVRNGNLQMNVSTKPSDTPSQPVTRYRLLKMFAVADCVRSTQELSSLPMSQFPRQQRQDGPWLQR